MLVAIHPDDYTAPSLPKGSDSAASRWQQFLEEAGHEVKHVNVRRADILDQLQGCDALMWRWAHFSGMARIARRLLPVVENQLGLPVYPDQSTCWHYDDKIAQAYLLQAAAIPSPLSWPWFEESAAIEWLETTATFPLVLKLATGAGSDNVRLVKSKEEAIEWTQKLFSRFRNSLKPLREQSPRAVLRMLRNLILKGRPPGLSEIGFEPQGGYIFFQEYLAGNDFDNRITVIGNRAFCFRRMNRPNDFRASGSGCLDYDHEAIKESMVRLAFRTAKTLAMQSCAIDGLYRDGQPLVAEVSYTFVSHAVYQCPGHWELEGEPEDGRLHWKAGKMWPEQAQVEDFLERCRKEAP